MPCARLLPPLPQRRLSTTVAVLLPVLLLQVHIQDQDVQAPGCVGCSNCCAPCQCRALLMPHASADTSLPAALRRCRPTQLAAVPVRPPRCVHVHWSRRAACAAATSARIITHQAHCFAAGEAGRRRPPHAYQAVMCDFSKTVSMWHLRCLLLACRQAVAHQTRLLAPCCEAQGVLARRRVLAGAQCAGVLVPPRQVRACAVQSVHCFVRPQCGLEPAWAC